MLYHKVTALTASMYPPGIEPALLTSTGVAIPDSYMVTPALPTGGPQHQASPFGAAARHPPSPLGAHKHHPDPPPLESDPPPTPTHTHHHHQWRNARTSAGVAIPWQSNCVVKPSTSLRLSRAGPVHTPALPTGGSTTPNVTFWAAASLQSHTCTLSHEHPFRNVKKMELDNQANHKAVDAVMQQTLALHRDDVFGRLHVVGHHTSTILAGSFRPDVSPWLRCRLHNIALPKKGFVTVSVYGPHL